MSEIQVIFPAVDPLSTAKTTAQVLAPTVVARERDRINWIFYNCDARIQYAEIEFVNTQHSFFPAATNGAPHKFGKGVSGTGDIYGDVPNLNANRPVLAKYTVRGWDSDKKTKCYSELDPEILVNEP